MTHQADEITEFLRDGSNRTVDDVVSALRAVLVACVKHDRSRDNAPGDRGLLSTFVIDAIRVLAGGARDINGAMGELITHHFGADDQELDPIAADEDVVRKLLQRMMIAGSANAGVFLLATDIDDSRAVVRIVADFGNDGSPASALTEALVGILNDFLGDGEAEGVA